MAFTPEQQANATAPAQQAIATAPAQQADASAPAQLANAIAPAQQANVTAPAQQARRAPARLHARTRRLPEHYSVPNAMLPFILAAQPPATQPPSRAAAKLQFKMPRGSAAF